MLVVRCRTDICTYRPSVTKKMNMVTESKYTSPPLSAKEFHTLAQNASVSARATGTSIPIVRCERLRHALAKMGRPA